MKKIEFYKNLIDKNIDIFSCPKCGESFILHDRTLVCNSRHCYDIAAKGYINFMSGTKINTEKYDKSLFESRQYIFENGFFNGLITKIREIINNNTDNPNLIVDIGCGEGSALDKIICDTKSLGVGIDIAKEGILVATARKENNIAWIVGDLTKIPLKDNCADVIINMLSPANYSEFDRILSKDGIIIKILPGKNYLKQIREFFYRGSDKEEYSNKQTYDYLASRYKNFIEQDVYYDIDTDKDFLYNLAKMSPLSNGKTEKDIELFVTSGISKISVDFKIVVATKVTAD